VLRYQFDCLLWRNDIVSVPRSDGARLGRVHDRFTHGWMSPEFLLLLVTTCYYFRL